MLHADGLSCPVIFFQGLDDFVVPPRQAEVLVEALRRRSIPVVYLAFEGEGHGFRRAETIITVAEAELTFFGEVLGFTPATGDDGDPNASPGPGPGNGTVGGDEPFGRLRARRRCRPDSAEEAQPDPAAGVVVVRVDEDDALPDPEGRRAPSRTRKVS